MKRVEYLITQSHYPHQGVGGVGVPLDEEETKAGHGCVADLADEVVVAAGKKRKECF